MVWAVSGTFTRRATLCRFLDLVSLRCHSLGCVWLMEMDESIWQHEKTQLIKFKCYLLARSIYQDGEISKKVWIGWAPPMRLLATPGKTGNGAITSFVWKLSNIYSLINDPHHGKSLHTYIMLLWKNFLQKMLLQFLTCIQKASISFFVKLGKKK